MKNFTQIILILLIIFNLNFYALANDDLIKAKDGVFIKKGVVVVSLNKISSSSVENQECFLAVVPEDIQLPENRVIPKNSILEGRVFYKREAKKYPQRDGFIKISVKKIYEPSGRVIFYDRSDSVFTLESPYKKKKLEKFLEVAPVALLIQAISIPLNYGTDINFGITYAIANGVAAVIGGVTGFLDPDPWKTKRESARSRGISSTVIGTTNGIVAEGESVYLNRNDYLIINFKERTISKIPDEMVEKYIIDSSKYQ